MRPCRWKKAIPVLLALADLLPCVALLLPLVAADPAQLRAAMAGDAPGFWQAFRNTALVAAGNLAVQWVVAVPAGLALSKLLPRRVARRILWLCVLLMLLPQQALILPQYLLLDRLHLLNRLGGLVLMSAFQPFLVLFYWFGTEQIETSLLEAAVCEGATTAQCFFRIYLPLLAPFLLAGGLLSAAESWNMLEQPMTFLQAGSQDLLSTYFLHQPQTVPALTALQALLSAFPLLLVFAVAAARWKQE